MELADFALPPFVIFNSETKDGLLKNRIIIQHIQTFTLIEVVADDLVGEYSGKKLFKFELENAESKGFVLLFSIFQKDCDQGFNENVLSVFRECKNWYCNHLLWVEQKQNNFIAPCLAPNMA